MAEGQPRDPYPRARVLGAGALIALVVVLGVLDAVSTDFSLDSIELGLLLGGILFLLGVEGASRFGK